MGSYKWKYKALDGLTYHILGKGMITRYLNEFILKEWQADHEDHPDQPWTVAWMSALEKLKFSLQRVPMDGISLRQDLMCYQTPEYNFQESLNRRVAEREESYFRGVSFEPLLIDGRNMQLMDGYSRYQVLLKHNHSIVYAYVGE
jgi:hypothetical protein